MKADKSVIILLSRKGLSYSDIGDFFGVSRQRIHQILKGYESPKLSETIRNRKLNPKPLGRPKKLDSEKISGKEYRKEYARKNLLFINGKQIRVNKRTRPNNICEICGRTVKRLDYHHWNDDKPEYGIWLCLTCHAMVECIDKGLGNKYTELRNSIEGAVY